MTPSVILEAFGRFATPAKTVLEDPPAGMFTPWAAGDWRRYMPLKAKTCAFRTLQPIARLYGHTP